MWWPTEFTGNQTLSTIWADLTNPHQCARRYGRFGLIRDYTEYAAVTGNTSLTLLTWSPDLLRMYIRRDVAAQIWEYGITPQPEEPKVDPYASNTISLDPIKVISVVGQSTFSAPRGIPLPDGSLFVADSRNHRIVHLDPTGLYLNSWGLLRKCFGRSSP